jgi:hypothetical protein
MVRGVCDEVDGAYRFEEGGSHVVVETEGIRSFHMQFVVCAKGGRGGGGLF